MDVTTLEPGDVIQHYKGGIYLFLGIGTHSETLLPLAIYQSLKKDGKGDMWLRPIEMFSDKVVHQGNIVDRFTIYDSSVTTP